VRRLPLTCAGLLLAAVAPAAPVHAAATAWRYRLAKGQTLTYMVDMRATDTLREGAAPARQKAAANSYDVHYDFGGAQPDGAVALRLRTDHLTERLTDGGKTTVKHPKTNPTYFWQEADGRQLSPDRRYTGAYSNGDLGMLPDGPVAPGSAWTTTLTDQDMFSSHLICHNTMAGWMQGTSTVAEIRTVCSASGHGTVTQRGTTYRVSGTTTLTGRWAFDVKLGLFLGQTLSQQTIVTGTETDRRGARAFNDRTQTSTMQQLVATR